MMRRLVQVEPYYSPPRVGGMEIRARERAVRLARAGWIVETLTSAEETRPHTIVDGNLIVRYLRSREVARTPIIFSLPRAIMRVPGDSVVQVETAIAYVPEMTALICKVRRMPYIARVPLDSAGHGKLRDTLLTFYQKTVLRWVYKNATLVIVLTEDDASLMATKYHVDPSKVRIIPNATDFVPMTSPRPTFHTPFRLLFAGRVTMQKNVPLLIDSLRYFMDTYSLPVHLDLIGDGEDMPLVKKMIADLALEEYVSLRGYVTGPALEAAFERADAFVMTSTHESFGQVLIEAMTKSLPAVASNIRCVRTVVRDGTSGLLVDLTKESFAEAYYRLITETGLYEKLSSGSADEARRYSWDDTINSYVSVYSEVHAMLRSRR